MKRWLEQVKGRLTRGVMAAVLAVAVVGSLATIEFAKPATAATAALAAAPLDDNSVAALLTLDRAMETLAARVTPAVVNVTVTSKTQKTSGQDTPDMQQFFGPFGGNPFGRQFRMQPQQPQIEHGLGSGVIISPDGYIVTNNHVIEGAVDIRVTMSNREVYPAKLVGADPLTDLAVLKIEGKNFPSVPWGNSTNLHPGQTVLAFGNPLGFRFTVTRGIISALNRPNPDPEDRRKPGEFIQTDAAINPGNSGGALVNARGELIGINTFLVSSSGSFSGMGFAIPAQLVQPTVETLIRDGKITHAFIGVQISDVTPDNAKFFQLKTAEGAVISQVDPNSPGAKGGLKTGDVVTELDGKPVTSAGQLQVAVGEKRPGDTIKLQVIRDGKPATVSVTLEAMKGSNDIETAGTERKGRWGLGLADLTPDVRSELQLQNSTQGAVVQQVQPGSPADNAGLQRGDVITEVNRQPVKSASDAAQALSKVPQGQDALVLVRSDGGSTYRVMHPTEG